jgi:hypothetical protein
VRKAVLLPFVRSSSSVAVYVRRTSNSERISYIKDLEEQPTSSAASADISRSRRQIARHEAPPVAGANDVVAAVEHARNACSSPTQGQIWCPKRRSSSLTPLGQFARYRIFISPSSMRKQKTPYRLLNTNKINSRRLFSKRTVADMTQQRSR